MAEAAKVAVEIDAEDLESAMARFERFTGSLSSAQRAMGQFGRLGETAVRGGGILTPDDYGKISRSLENIKRIESDITKQITDRKSQFDAMLQKSPELAKHFQNIERLGGKPGDLLGVLQGMSANSLKSNYGLTEADIASLTGVLKSLPGLEAQQAKYAGAGEAEQGVVDKITEGLPRRMEASFDRIIPRMGRMLQFALGTAGIGGALGILGQSRARGTAFYTTAMEAGFMGGMGSRGVSQLEQSAHLAAGLTAGTSPEALQDRYRFTAIASSWAY